MPSSATRRRTFSTKDSVVSTPTSDWINKSSRSCHISSSMSPEPNSPEIWPKNELRVRSRLRHNLPSLSATHMSPRVFVNIQTSIIRDQTGGDKKRHSHPLVNQPGLPLLVLPGIPPGARRGPTGHGNLPAGAVGWDQRVSRLPSQAADAHPNHIRHYNVKAASEAQRLSASSTNTGMLMGQAFVDSDCFVIRFTAILEPRNACPLRNRRGKHLKHIRYSGASVTSACTCGEATGADQHLSFAVRLGAAGQAGPPAKNPNP